MVSIVIGRRAAAGTSLASAVLGIAVLAPRTGRIAMITVIRSAISTGTAGCRSAMLTGRRIAPRAVAHAMAGVFVIRISAVPAIGFAPVLTAGIFLPASIGIASERKDIKIAVQTADKWAVVVRHDDVSSALRENVVQLFMRFLREVNGV